MFLHANRTKNLIKLYSETVFYVDIHFIHNLSLIKKKCSSNLHYREKWFDTSHSEFVSKEIKYMIIKPIKLAVYRIYFLDSILVNAILIVQMLAELKAHLEFTLVRLVPRSFDLLAQV